MLDNKAIGKLQIAFLVVFIALFVNILYISVTGKHFVSGSNIDKYASKRDIKEENISAKRGTIYDRNGEIIAKDTYKYTIIAYLNDKRYDEINKKPAFVTDPAEYAKKLAPILKTSEANLYKLLNKNAAQRNKYYQTELGSKGKGLSLNQKERIEKLELPGIEFTQVISRYYPNGVFASSTIGYTTYDEKKQRMIGQLGIESKYDDYLKGSDGYRKVQLDGHGFVRSELEDRQPVDGSDVYLTLDNNIQRIVESNMDDMMRANKAKFALAVVTDAKTNEILALSNRPTFNPNKLNIKDFTNPFVALQFEPGSTMKTFTYSTAKDVGVYNGKSKFYSGPTNIYDNGKAVQRIQNYNNNNWGKISYDEGFMRSSNTGIINLFNKYLNTKDFEEYLYRFGFFKKTGIDIAGESSGRKQMDIKQEKFTTGFGQASAITPVQLIQAFSAITNDGKMMQPFVTKKIVSNDDKVLEIFEPKHVGTPIKKKTATSMLKLMSEVVENPKGSGYKHYRIKDYKIAGKTGTAQYVENGKYLDCATCYYTSFLMAAPASDPDVIIYLVTKRDTYPSYDARGKFIRNVASNTLAYLNSTPDKKNAKSKKPKEIFEIESFINKSVDYSTKKLDNIKVKYHVLGNGSTIINQMPLPYSETSTSQKVFLLTDSKYYKMIDLRGLSKSDVLKYASLLNLKVAIKGNGYVSSQSIRAGTILNDRHVLKIILN